MSYIENENMYSFVIAQTEVAKYFPYIIQFYSPTYLNTVFRFRISNNKKSITPEQLIGVTCGSISVFFLILAIVIFIIRKRHNNYQISDSLDMSYDDESTVIIYRLPHNNDDNDNINEISTLEYSTTDLKNDVSSEENSNIEYSDLLL